MQMFLTILVASLLVAANALPHKQTGLDKTLRDMRSKLSDWIEPVIYGGETADKGEFPHMVQLQYSGGHYCGASVIAENLVLTAAHCVDSGSSSMTVVAGQHQLSVDDGDEQEFDISEVHIHPDYGTAGYDYDIAVLVIDGAFEFNEFVQPIAVWEEKETPMVPAKVSGWGDTETGGTPDKLKKLDLTIYEKDVCKNAYGDIFTDNMLCATGSIDGGQCVCFGDSGSPMYIEQDGTKYQVGIVSWGNPCANAGYPAAYAEVGKFVNTVKKMVKANALPQKTLQDMRSKLSDWIEPVIYGGETADKGEFPHMVQLQYSGGHYCGASVIAENLVLTAAHCVDSGSSSMTVVAGQHQLSVDDGDEQEFDIAEVHIHPDYGTAGYDYDIAVLVIDGSFDFNDFVQPIAVWEEKETPMVPAKVSGWGDTETGGTPDKLKKLDLTIYEKDVCKNAYGDIFTDNMLCATGSIDGGQCVCFGDSGSPMYIEQDGTKYQVGIVSWGNPCANAGYPAAYAEVGKFVNKVKKMVKGL